MFTINVVTAHYECMTITIQTSVKHLETHYAAW